MKKIYGSKLIYKMKKKKAHWSLINGLTQCFLREIMEWDNFFVKYTLIIISLLLILLLL